MIFYSFKPKIYISASDEELNNLFSDDNEIDEYKQKLLDEDNYSSKKKKKTPLKQIKKQIKSLNTNNHFIDCLTGGILGVLKYKHEQSKYNFQNFKNKILPFLEFFIKYSDAFSSSFCLFDQTSNGFKELSILNFGVRILFLVIGMGDGFFRSYLPNHILNKTRYIFYQKCIYQENNIFQYTPDALNAGIQFCFFENLFMALCYQFNRREKEQKHGISVFLHGDFEYCFINIYANLFINNFYSFDVIFLRNSILIHGRCLRSENIRNYYFFGVFNIVQFAFSFITNGFKVLSDFFSINIGGSIEESNFIFIFSFSIRISFFEIFLCFDSKNSFHIIITFKYSSGNSFIESFQKINSINI